MEHTPRSPTRQNTGSIATYNSKNRMDRLMDDLEVMKRGYRAVLWLLDKHTDMVHDDGGIDCRVRTPLVFAGAIVGALLRIGDNVKEGN